jgi:diaminopimelate decarboxylase
MTPPWPRTAVLEDQRLVAVGGMEPEALAEEFGTPLYVLDEAELVGRMRAYRQALGPDAQVVYAAKALCVTGVLTLAAREGLAIDVASEGELSTALRAGVPPSGIFVHGSNKADRELRMGAQRGVGRVVVDSAGELARVDALGVRRGRPLGVLLRVTPGVEAHTHAFITTGQDDSKFGFTLSTGLAHEAVAQALKLAGVALRGVHCHIGSQVTALPVFVRAAELMVGLLADVRDRHGVELGELNLGGGLGIAQTTGEAEVDIDRYAAALRDAVVAACAARGLPLPRLAVEPGRSIVGPAGITLYTVGTIKELPGVRTYVSVDGGMSDNPRPALYGARYAFAAAGGGTPASDGSRLATIVGKHCESGDVLARDVELPVDLAEGDLLAAAATGAYTYSMASNYNRVPRPAMVLVAGGQAELLVRRETIDDLLRHDVPLLDSRG